jgi:retron-type reverse transcriptase
MIKQLTSKENLNAAYLQVYRNKGVGGVGKSMQTLKSTLQANGKRYIKQVERGVYKPSPTLGVEIPKGNGKTRLLRIPTTKDRVFQQALNQVLAHETLF